MISQCACTGMSGSQCAGRSHGVVGVSWVSVCRWKYHVVPMCMKSIMESQCAGMGSMGFQCLEGVSGSQCADDSSMGSWCVCGNPMVLVCISYFFTGI